MASEYSDNAVSRPALWSVVDPVVRDPLDTPQWSTLATIGGLVRRDVRVMWRDLVPFLIRVVLHPLLFVLVFTYVLPSINEGFDDMGRFATVLFPGLLAVALFSQSSASVALSLSLELGASREIEDRVMVPIPLAGVAATKVALGAARGLLAVVLVAPIGYFLPAGQVDLHVSSWALLVAVLVLGGVASASLGLALGVLLMPKDINMVFSAFLVPLTFLGCVYYPWASLSSLTWLQYAVLSNPLVYIAEGLRAAMTSHLPHMSVGPMLTALVVATILAGSVGTRWFVRRLVN